MRNIEQFGTYRTEFNKRIPKISVGNNFMDGLYIFHQKSECWIFQINIRQSMLQVSFKLIRQNIVTKNVHIQYVLRNINTSHVYLLVPVL